MAATDFTIETLADYLHISTAQVNRLVERGKLPARRVGGQWRFSVAEVNHWLEERIGLSSDAELQQMETALVRAAGDSEMAAPQIAELLPLECIALPLPARTRSSVIDAMCQLAAQSGWLWDPAGMAEAVRSREEMMSTALDCGAALLHPRRPPANMLERSFIAFGRTATGIPFGNARGTMTDLFFLLASTDDQTHLRTLARLSRLLQDDIVLEALRTAEFPQLLLETIAEREALLL
jgi:PTS system nitrogen regulatory IIA component